MPQDNTLLGLAILLLSLFIFSCEITHAKEIFVICKIKQEHNKGTYSMLLRVINETDTHFIVYSGSYSALNLDVLNSIVLKTSAIKKLECKSIWPKVN